MKKKREATTEPKPSKRDLSKLSKAEIRQLCEEHADEIRKVVTPSDYFTCAECGTLVRDGYKCYVCKPAPKKDPPPPLPVTKDEVKPADPPDETDQDRARDKYQDDEPEFDFP